MDIYHNRPTVADIRAMKARGEKISMIYVSTLEEARAAAAAGIHMLSIEAKYFSQEMREAAGDCFVQVGLPYGGWGRFEGRPIATAEDYLRAAFHYAGIGGDAYYCSASYDIQKTLWPHVKGGLLNDRANIFLRPCGNRFHRPLKLFWFVVLPPSKEGGFFMYTFPAFTNYKSCVSIMYKSSAFTNYSSQVGTEPVWRFA